MARLWKPNKEHKVTDENELLTQLNRTADDIAMDIAQKPTLRYCKAYNSLDDADDEYFFTETGDIIHQDDWQDYLDEYGETYFITKRQDMPDELPTDIPLSAKDFDMAKW